MKLRRCVPLIKQHKYNGTEAVKSTHGGIMHIPIDGQIHPGLLIKASPKAN